MCTNAWSDRAVALLSADGLRHNVREIRRTMQKDVQLCGVVKADAYGHGAVPTARILKEEGVSWLAVSTAKEALELRSAGIDGPILVLGVVPVDFAETAGRLAISLSVHEQAYGEALKDAAGRAGTAVHVHVKLDTGMTRLGYATVPDDLTDTVTGIRRLFSGTGLIAEGLFSHFAASESDEAFSKEQIRRYLSVYERLRDLPFAVRHIGNSGALAMCESPFNMCRSGIALYGGQPDPLHPDLDLKPVMSVFGRIVQIKTLSQTETVGYSRTVRLPAGARVAVVEIGYADGVIRRWEETGYMLVRGQKAPLAGRVSMDRLVINISELDVSAGDYALYFGTDKSGAVLSADDVAARAGTISYELFCRISARVPRIWESA